MLKRSKRRLIRLARCVAVKRVIVLLVEVHSFLRVKGNGLGTFSLKKFKCFREFDSKIFFFLRIDFGKAVEHENSEYWPDLSNLVNLLCLAVLLVKQVLVQRLALLVSPVVVGQSPLFPHFVRPP
jgi:hypothetical protein